jgi:glycosyltransferase involved in cell wall biosynthesis
MRITCVIPTLGRGKILCDTIRMLFVQSHKPHEIIVVDQTETYDEETHRTLSEWSEKGCIRWLHQVEPNASLARNVGALAATGDVLLFLDDDIEIGTHFVAAHARNYVDHKVVAVAGQVLEGGRRVTMDDLRPAATSKGFGWIYFPKNYGRRCHTQWMVSGNFSIQKEVFISVGGMDANYCKGAFREEADFAQRFQRAGHRFIFDPQASVYHLGMTGAPAGGSRTWISNKRIAGWHHCIGDWYFRFGYLGETGAAPLLRFSFRHFVLNRYNITHPWWLPFLFLRWLAAIPVAAYLRWRGPRLIACESLL